MQSVLKSVLNFTPKHPVKSSVHIVRRGCCIAAQSVAVDAECIHTLRVAHKPLDLTGRQGLYHADKAVAQFIHRDRRYPVGFTIDLPALVIIRLADQLKDALAGPGGLPLLIQHSPRTF